MPLGAKVGLGPDRIVLHGDTAHPPKGHNCWRMSIVAKRSPISATAEHLYINLYIKCNLLYLQYQLACGPMPNVTAAQPNIGGAICESSVIPFLVPYCKVWLTHTDRVPCSNAANIGEHKTWTQSDVCTGQNSVSGQKPPKKVYIVYQSRRRPNIVQSLVGL